MKKKKNKYGTPFPIDTLPDIDPAVTDTGRNQKSGKAKRKEPKTKPEDYNA